MRDRAEIVRTILDERVVAVLRLDDAESVLRAADAVYGGGIRIVEVTLTTPGALKAIERLASDGPADMIAGAGSVLDSESAMDAVSAGASFIVSPVFRPEVVQIAQTWGAAAMPGAFTPGEILAAHDAGADIVKVFPADVLGMAFFRAVLAPMPHLRLMPTGGVTIENAGAWIAAGACAVGIGSALVDRAAMRAGDMAAITERARILAASLRR